MVKHCVFIVWTFNQSDKIKKCVISQVKKRFPDVWPKFHGSNQFSLPPGKMRANKVFTILTFSPFAGVHGSFFPTVYTNLDSVH